MKPSSMLRLVFGVVVAGAVVAASMGFVEVSLARLDNGDLLTVLLTAIFVALVIERAVEVYGNNRFDPEKRAIRARVLVLESRIAIKEKALQDELARAEPDAAAIKALRPKIAASREELIAEQEKIAAPLADYASRKAAFAGAAATVLGLAAAIVGVRVIGQFLPVDAAGAITGPLGSGTDAARLQLAAFRFADVVLTTALLAGGADGIHQIVKRFTDIRSGG